MNKGKLYLSNVLVLLIATTVCLFVIEAAIRATMTLEEVYDATWFMPALNERKFKLAFLRNHENGDGLNPAFYDEKLGWDMNKENGRIRPDDLPDRLSHENALKVVTIGDSFSYGVGVEANETFTSQLRSFAGGIDGLNLAVSAYGIDQAYLKFRMYGASLHPDIIVLGVYPGNYVRSTVSFFSSAKPRFDLTANGDLEVVENRVVPRPADYVGDIQRMRRYAVYAWEFLIARGSKTRFFQPDLVERYFRHHTPIIEKMLANLKTYADENGAVLMIVQIPPGDAFQNPIAYDQLRSEAVRNQLISIYEKLGIDYVDLISEFLADSDMEGVFERYYMHNENRVAGHLSVDGNRMVASILADRLCGGLLPPDMKKRAQC